MADYKRYEFKTLAEAEFYWKEHFGGQYKDSDEENRQFERWLEGVVIEEVEQGKDPFSPSIAKLQADITARGESNYPPGFDPTNLD